MGLDLKKNHSFSATTLKHRHRLCGHNRDKRVWSCFMCLSVPWLPPGVVTQVSCSMSSCESVCVQTRTHQFSEGVKPGISSAVSHHGNSERRRHFRSERLCSFARLVSRSFFVLPKPRPTAHLYLFFSNWPLAEAHPRSLLSTTSCD